MFENCLSAVSDQRTQSLPGIDKVLAKYRELLTQVKKGT
jgi:hypothetical protein